MGFLVLGFTLGVLCQLVISLKNEDDLVKWYKGIIEEKDEEIKNLMNRRR